MCEISSNGVLIASASVGHFFTLNSELEERDMNSGIPTTVTAQTEELCFFSSFLLLLKLFFVLVALQSLHVSGVNPVLASGSYKLSNDSLRMDVVFG